MGVNWVTASGKGTVHSWTVSYQAFHPSFEDFLPLVLATVELNEGVRMNCRLADVTLDEIAIGLPVRIHFEDVGEELTLPFFRVVRDNTRL